MVKGPNKTTKLSLVWQLHFITMICMPKDLRGGDFSIHHKSKKKTKKFLDLSTETRAPNDQNKSS